MDQDQRVRHTFQSWAASNQAGKFQFQFRESIQNVIGMRIESVTIKDFMGANTSYIYLLGSDLLTYGQDSSRYNNTPNNIIFTIPNNPAYVGGPLHRTNEADGLYRTWPPQFISGLYFQLFDEIHNLVNPADAGWSFTVELELLIKKNC